MKKPSGKIFACVIVLFALLAAPNLHRLVGAKAYCIIYSIDINSAKVKKTRYLAYVPLYTRVDETALSGWIAQRRLQGTPPRWVESIVRAGYGDYYPRPLGGKLLSEVQRVEVMK